MRQVEPPPSPSQHRIPCWLWNSDFPTRAESICWRVASLVSALLPAAALGISLFLSYVSTKFAETRAISILSTKLKPLEQLGPAWWQLLENPVFTSWDEAAQLALISTPRYRRKWEEYPSREALDPSENDMKPAEDVRILRCYLAWLSSFRKFRRYWMEHARANTQPALIRETWFRFGSDMESDLDRGGEPLREFIRDYESFARRKLGRPARVLPNNTMCVDHIMQAYDETMGISFYLELLKQACTLWSTWLTICTGIIYTASRLTIMVLLFTTLRRVPAGVYQDTQWTRFLPSFS